jgi:hypothetical protein
MHITFPQRKSPSRFKIKSVRVEHGPYLDLSLEPAPQGRDRGSNQSFEARKIPTEMTISFAELHRMLEAVTHELFACHGLLERHRDLWVELDDAREKAKKLNPTQ